jgi:hypothetical protein
MTDVERERPDSTRAENIFLLGFRWVAVRAVAQDANARAKRKPRMGSRRSILQMSQADAGRRHRRRIFR